MKWYSKQLSTTFGGAFDIHEIDRRVPKLQSHYLYRTLVISNIPPAQIGVKASTLRSSVPQTDSRNSDAERCTPVQHLNHLLLTRLDRPDGDSRKGVVPGVYARMCRRRGLGLTDETLPQLDLLWESLTTIH